MAEREFFFVLFRIFTFWIFDFRSFLKSENLNDFVEKSFWDTDFLGLLVSVITVTVFETRLSKDI